MPHFFIFFALLLSFNVAAVESSNANESLGIRYFYDGDTVKIVDHNIEYKLRLTEIDAPEKAQAYGLKSRRALMQFCKGATVQVLLSGVDKYQRNLGKLYCNQQDASVFMVKNGHAWFNSRYSMDGTLFAAQQNAQLNKLGLWQSKQQTPPWVWRKNHPHY